MLPASNWPLVDVTVYSCKRHFFTIWTVYGQLGSQVVRFGHCYPHSQPLQFSVRAIRALPLTGQLKLRQFLSKNEKALRTER